MHLAPLTRLDFTRRDSARRADHTHTGWRYRNQRLRLILTFILLSSHN